MSPIRLSPSLCISIILPGDGFILIPAFQLLDYAFNQLRDRIRDRLRQLCAPLRRIGLHAEYHNFPGRFAEQLERDHKIRVSQLMHGPFPGRP